MFEALDLVRSEVERRFDQVGIQVAAGQEQAIIEAAQGKKVNVTSLKLTSFTRERLSHELDKLREICTGREVNTIRDVVSILQTMQPQTNPFHAVRGGKAHQTMPVPAHICRCIRALLLDFAQVENLAA